MKTLFFLLILTTSLLSQQPVVLQPWMQVEGTYNGQRLGSSVGFAGKIGDSTIITVSDVNGIRMYHVKTPSDTTVFQTYQGLDCSLGDFNGDGIQDLLVSGNPTKIYLGISSGVFDTIPFFTKYQELGGYSFGQQVSIGKINEDNCDDLITTDAGYPNGDYVGRVYIFFGETQMDTTAYYVLNGIHQLNGFGYRIALGDLNNDGFKDIIVKGLDASESGPNGTILFPYIKIFLGGNTIDTTVWKYLEGTLYTYYGVTSFDVNNDGKDDLLWTIWNPQDSLTYINIHFSNGDIDTIPSLILKNPYVANFGWEVKNAGDMNGDGYDDILVSTYEATIDAGYVFIFSGGPDMDANFDAAVGMGGVSKFGYSTSSIGDVNGDGYSDIIVGAYAYRWYTEKGYWGIFLGDSSIPVTSVSEEDIPQPKDFVLYQNYPNPFNPSTVIGYKLSVISNVKLTVYNLLGKEISTLVNEEKPAGEYEIKFDASNLSSGVYYYKLTLTDTQGNKQTKTKSMILLK